MGYRSGVPVAIALLVVAAVVVAILVSRPAGRRPDFDAASRAKRVALILMMGAGVMLVVSFTQFRFLRGSTSSGTIVLVMDVSESMSRDDVEPTRLQAAKDAASAFVQDLPDELAVGLVVFSGTATVLEPPSILHELVVDALVGLPRGEGTVIGDGISTALDAIEARWARDGQGPAAVVVLSDGRDTGSLVEPDDAAARAAELEIPLYTVVLGEDLSGEQAGANVELMAEVATTSGGEPFTATTAGGLLQVYETLEERLSSELALSDFGALFVGAAGVLALSATVALLLALRQDF